MIADSLPNLTSLYLSQQATDEEEEEEYSIEYNNNTNTITNNTITNNTIINNYTFSILFEQSIANMLSQNKKILILTYDFKDNFIYKYIISYLKRNTDIYNNTNTLLKRATSFIPFSTNYLNSNYLTGIDDHLTDSDSVENLVPYPYPHTLQEYEHNTYILKLQQQQHEREEREQEEQEEVYKIEARASTYDMIYGKSSTNSNNTNNSNNGRNSVYTNTYNNNTTNNNNNNTNNYEYTEDIFSEVNNHTAALKRLSYITV